MHIGRNKMYVSIEMIRTVHSKALLSAHKGIIFRIIRTLHFSDIPWINNSRSLVWTWHSPAVTSYSQSWYTSLEC